MCYHAYFLLVVASHAHMNCLQDVNVIYTLCKNVFYAIRAPMYRASQIDKNLNSKNRHLSQCNLKMKLVCCCLMIKKA